MMLGTTNIKDCVCLSGSVQYDTDTVETPESIEIFVIVIVKSLRNVVRFLVTFLNFNNECTDMNII